MMTRLIRAAGTALVLSLIFSAGCSTAPPTSRPSGSPRSAPTAIATSPAPPRPTAETPSPLPVGTRSAAPMTRAHGTVKAIQKEQRTLDVEHEALPALGLKAGTTHFSARSFEVVTDVSPGDEIDFDVVREKNILVIVDAVPMAR